MDMYNKYNEAEFIPGGACMPWDLLVYKQIISFSEDKTLQVLLKSSPHNLAIVIFVTPPLDENANWNPVKVNNPRQWHELCCRYGTDNGACYYYTTGSNYSNYEDLIIAVKKDADQNGLPFQYVQVWMHFSWLSSKIKLCSYLDPHLVQNEIQTQE